MQIAWIGLGKMGAPMAGRLQRAGHALAVYNRSRAKARPLVEQGARAADSPAAAAQGADVVFTMIADDAALETVTVGASGALGAMGAGSTLIDMSTVSPRVSRVVAQRAADRGAAYLRAPVSGSTQFAESGRLTIFASGPREAFEAATPLFQQLGQQVYYVGAGDEARVLKLVVNMLVGTTAAMVAEALALGEKSGLDWAQMIEIVQHSVVGSPLVGYKAKALTAREFPAAFSVDQIAKDYDLALGVARDVHAAVPVAAVSRQLFEGMRATGRGGMDFFAVLLLVEEMAGLRPGAPPV
jgi:3-hydroxyisobutyrate dehydrogenase-like beta-hydroxyacid dehydrogenase